MLSSTPSKRKALLRPVKRAVIKVGSGVLTERRGLNMAVVEGLASDISHLRRKGTEIILVSSGAIASGLRELGLTKRPQSLSAKQALAAIGQPMLMKAYEEIFGHHGVKVAQILVTRDDLIHRRRYLNARNTLFALLAWKIIPIINENDTVAVEEIKFGDNDNLSALVTNLSESHLVVNLTNLEGLFDKDPKVHPDARLIKVVERVDRKVSRYASAIPNSVGTGGMASKLQAAQKVALAGVPTIIANGLKPHILLKIFAGEEEGTLFLPQAHTLCSRKHWIVFTQSPRGELIIDPGAEKAILERGKSLLPSGVLEVRGRFSLGNSVVLLNENAKEIAVGLVNYPSGDIRKIMGRKTSEIESVLGFKHDDEVIHRDNLVLMNALKDSEDLCHWKS